MTSVVHHAQGVWPYTSQPPFRLVRWISEVWVLYNTFLMDLGLTEVPTGKINFVHRKVARLAFLGIISYSWYRGKVETLDAKYNLIFR